MKANETKTTVNALNELNESCRELTKAMKGTIEEARATKQLSRQRNNQILIKLGLALIAFPDPTISDVVGAFLVAAGTVQQRIQRRTIYVEDVYKTFQGTLEEIWATRHSV